MDGVHEDVLAAVDDGSPAEVGDHAQVVVNSVAGRGGVVVVVLTFNLEYTVCFIFTSIRCDFFTKKIN